MKPILAFVLLLSLTLGGFSGLGYVEYKQHLQISDLQFQITTLQTKVQVQGATIFTQNKAIVRIRTRATIVEDALVKVVAFINALTDDSGPQPETKHQSLPSS